MQTPAVGDPSRIMRAPRRLDPDRVAEQLPRLYRAARAWTGSREEAEDLVQETCARVLARPRLLRGDDELAYLLRALRNTLVSQRRARSRRPETTELVEEVGPASRPGDDPAAATENRQVYAAIHGFPRSSGTPWWRWTSWGSHMAKPRGRSRSRKER